LANILEDGGPAGVAAGGGVGVFFDAEGHVDASARRELAETAGEVPGLE
jgi:hypothetical protein